MWVSYGALFPTWVGRSYNDQQKQSSIPDDFRRPKTWHSGGVFGLRGASGFHKRAPIWSPPMAHSDAIHPSVRWPWQSPSQHAHVEIALARVFARWSVGIIVLGFIFRGVNWIRPSEKPDALLSIAWSISLSLVIAWLCIFALAAFSMGYAATDPIVVGVLSFGALAGLMYGFGAHWRRHSRIKATRLGTDPPPNRTTAADPNGEASRQVRQIGTGLLWFTLGIIAGFCITWAAGSIASLFRGPIVGVWELGTPRYAHDQTPVNVAAGFGILATGWLLGILLVLRRQSRGFALGLLVATTVLGIMFALWH